MDHLFSCESATCTVPHAFRDLFRGAEELVSSSEGWEPGALNLAQGFAMRFRTPLLHTEITRLLVDVEQDGEARWSRFSATLPEATRNKLVERYLVTYRNQLRTRIATGLTRYQRVLHVMVHTDPDLRERIVLETPAASVISREYAGAWVEQLVRKELRVKQEGAEVVTPLAAALAGEFSGSGYIQIRLRVSQGFFLEGKPWGWSVLKKFLLDSLMLVGSRQVDAVNGPTDSSTARC